MKKEERKKSEETVDTVTHTHTHTHTQTHTHTRLFRGQKG